MKIIKNLIEKAKVTIHKTKIMAWIGTLKYANINEWNIETCTKFLMLSETTQKRLPGLEGPHKPCAVKEIVCQRLRFLLSEHLNLETPPNNKSSGEQSLVNRPQDMPFINTANLELMILRNAFANYPKLLMPLSSFTTVTKFNHDLKILQEQLLNLLAWLNTQNNNSPQISVASVQEPSK